ncbi:protein Shroom4 isoform X2 [Phascolarctos cinereus]|uniref:Protein Shroom4 isoform X2 n=1 Tax=Phascolarctos cinereus TaxID=38626 RepID=A0A6P5JT81_PHACI|nr:protein Shroom4 isoform X2 [Phascolarctos cinereus]
MEPGGSGEGSEGPGARMEPRPGACQYAHVQLQGGAPWGFTLKGGLEHGEPLLVSKIEDGGKAALSRKMRIGDELVNINGTPLYGSRQEALILIKGSFRILKMIVRRRTTPLARPHSWHMAKLLEGRPEVAAASMNFPEDPFSLSWHSGCDTSDLCMQWCPLSRHGSTEKSSSIGSMESLEQPSQMCHEGHVSPVEQSTYQSQRDSAYSSFSAGSSASDYALPLRPEETAASDCSPPGLGPAKAPNGLYLHTGPDGAAGPLGHQPSPSPQEGPLPGPAQVPGALPSPPQPPVRRDSLRASKAQFHQTEKRRASVPGVALYLKERWNPETLLSSDLPAGPCCPCSQVLEPHEGHWKECLSDEQYCMVSCPSESGHCDPELRLRGGPRRTGWPGQDQVVSSSPGGETEEEEAAIATATAIPAHLTGLTSHRHSAPEQLLASQIRSLHLGVERDGDSEGAELQARQEGHHWTLSPLHSAHLAQKSPCHLLAGAQNKPGEKRTVGQAGGQPLTSESSGQSSPTPGGSSSEAGAVQLSGLEDAPQQASSDEGLEAKNGHPGDVRRSSGTRYRSSQPRRRSERFATNLRHEIQRRKAQLQKIKGESEEPEPVEETEEPAEAATPATAPSPQPPAPAPGASPPLPAPAPGPSPPLPAPPQTPAVVAHRRLPSPGDRFSDQTRPNGNLLRARSSECLNQTTGSQEVRTPLEGPGSPGQRPWQSAAGLHPWCKASGHGPSKPRPQSGARGGRWRWSPERKLQPQLTPIPGGGLNLSEEELGGPSGEEGIFVPFADRKKFFEDTSKSLPPAASSLGHSKPFTLRLKPLDPPPFQPVSAGCRDLRRHSVDQAYHSSASLSPEPATYSECFVTKELEQPMCYQPLAHCGDFECLRPCSCSCGIQAAVGHDTCSYCPILLKRSLLSGHRSHRCHPQQWAHCTACCHPGPQHKVGEEGSPSWKARNSSLKEVSPDEWESAKITRKAGQPVRERSHYKIGCPHACFENPGREWSACYRVASSLDLLCDYDHSVGTLMGSAVYEQGSLVPPLPRPLRGRAFSESHINLDSPSTRARERRELLTKVDETRPDPLGARKKAPPPPRPPPPNWAKYRGHRLAQHSQYAILETSVGRQSDTALEQPRPQGAHVEVVRKRSQSLPPEPLPRDFPPQSAGDRPGPEQPGPQYYHPGGVWRMPEQLGLKPDPATSARAEALVEEHPKAKDTWSQGRSPSEEQYRLVNWSPEQQRLSPAGLATEESGSLQDATEVETCRLVSTRRSASARINSEELMRDVADRDRSLAGILNSASNMVTAAEVMGDLFPTDDLPWKKHVRQDWHLVRRRQEVAKERQEFQPISPPPPSGSLSSPTSPTSPTCPTSYSAYYNTSAGKAELLNKMKELSQLAKDSLGEAEVDHELAQKKLQLIASISKKLSVLQEAQQGLLEDISANVALGEEVEAVLKAVCKTNEFDKFRLFIGDLDKVVNLLLSLSGRLARVENALNSLDPESTQEKLALMEKKRQLTEQLEDAKELKEHVDRREKAVYSTVSRYLLQEQLQDYRHFVKMKSALIMEQRELEEKIKLGEEQLKCLRESLLLGPPRFLRLGLRSGGMREASQRGGHSPALPPSIHSPCANCPSPKKCLLLLRTQRDPTPHPLPAPEPAYRYFPRRLACAHGLLWPNASSGA